MLDITTLEQLLVAHARLGWELVVWYLFHRRRTKEANEGLELKGVENQTAENISRETEDPVIEVKRQATEDESNEIERTTTEECVMRGESAVVIQSQDTQFEAKEEILCACPVKDFDETRLKIPKDEEHERGKSVHIFLEEEACGAIAMPVVNPVYVQPLLQEVTGTEHQKRQDECTMRTQREAWQPGNNSHAADKERTQTTKRIFVRNINYRTRKTDLWSFFSFFGKVRSCQTLRNQKKRFRGLAVITFASEEDASRALRATPEELYLDDRQLIVERAHGRSRDRGATSTQAEDAWDGHVVTSSVVRAETEGQTEIDSNWEANNGVLNEDILLHVFSFLSLRQRIQVERVCRLWRHVALRSWQTLEHFDATCLVFNFGGINDRRLKLLLARTNPARLRSIDLSIASRNITDSSLSALGRCCPNICSLDLTRVDVSNRRLRLLAQQCVHLETIILDNCHCVGEDGLWWLFRYCKNLKHLNLVSNKRLKGQCFHVISHNVEVLVLSACSKLQDLGLAKISLKCPALIELRIDECTQLTDDALEQLTQGCTRLEKLNLSKIGLMLTETGLENLGQLSQLRELDLSFNRAVTDSILLTIAHGCELLESLDIASCQSVRDPGILALRACQKLTSLCISYLFLVSDESLVAVVREGRLKKLTCRGCITLTDQALYETAVHSNVLEELDVSGCDRLTVASLRFFQLVPRQVPLTIFAGGTALALEHGGLATNLTVSCVNRCDQRLCQHFTSFYELDFDDDSFDDDMFHMEYDDDMHYLDYDDPLAFDYW